MATWEDGPEYAPLERPELFRAPASAVALLPGPAEPNPAEGAPTVPPAAYQPPAAAPLEQVVVPDKDVRDPREPYEVAAATMAPDTSSAWSATHFRPPTHPFETRSTVAVAPAPAPVAQFDPNRPIAASSWIPPVQQLPGGPAGPAGPWGAPAAPPVQPMPAPGPTSMVTEQGWFAPVGQGPAPAPMGVAPMGPAMGPATTAPVRTRPPGLSVGLIVKAMTPVVAGLLVLGAVAALLGPVSMIAPVAFAGAAICGFLFVRVRARFVRTILALGLGFVLFLGFVTLVFDGTTADLWWDSLSGISSLASVLSLAAIGAAMASAIRSGEFRG